MVGVLAGAALSLAGTALWTVAKPGTVSMNAARVGQAGRVSSAAPAPARTAPIQMVPATGQLNLVNQERASAGLPPLTWNQCLAGVAATQARRLAHQGYVSSADGTVAAAGCRLGLTPPAEVLAYWPDVSDTQLNAVLVANPGDRAELLGPYRYLGANWAVGPTGVAFLAVELM